MAARLGLLVVAGFSVVILFSFGGQLIVAPALIPAQWVIARRTSGRISMAFSILGAVLVAEVVWLILGLAIGDGAVLVLGIGAMALGIAASVGFFYSSRPVK